MKRLYLAFFNSLRGLRWAWRFETAVRQEMILLVIAVPLAGVLAQNLMGFVALVSAVLLLLAVELLNTAVEKLSDHITPEHHPQIGIVKDLGSAAVFAALVLNLLVWGAAVWLRFFA
ncbi:MAG: diacylglycerol kinase [Proteobacteria bacterium]|nr:diacylglycerol kinase [Pseudomonadota bacterium]